MEGGGFRPCFFTGVEALQSRVSNAESAAHPISAQGRRKQLRGFCGSRKPAVGGGSFACPGRDHFHSVTVH